MIVELGLAALELLTATPKFSIGNKGVINLKGQVSTEIQIIGNNILKHGDINALWMHNCGNNPSDFYKFRGQFLPVKYKGVSAGVVAQHVDGTAFPAHSEIGIVTRLSGGKIKDNLRKVDFRYFPETNTFDTYGFINFNLGKRMKMFADFLADYNHKTNNGSLRPGLYYKVNDYFTMGVRYKFPIIDGKIYMTKENAKKCFNLTFGAKF